ncbi:hypothetical protein Q1695_014192 [Nippostrongylus brasiliensis]|nr:hypothetical protein Q1695_014192 [Nippostrongylus brasiliensis]
MVNTTTERAIPDGMTPISDSLMEIMLSLLSAYLSLCIFGFICSLVNLPLLVVFLWSRRLRRDSKLLICLAFGDLCNCLSLALMGFDRYTLYIRSLPIQMVPLVTSLSCASIPYIWLRIIGNVWPPSVLMIMGIERVIACMTPIWYVKYVRDRDLYACAISVAVVVIFCSIGLALAISNHSNGYVKFDCGRKATFSVAFAQGIYYWEMLGYFCALLLNIIAYIKAKSIVKNRTVRDQLKRIRYGIALGILSTILVSLPNVKSLFLEQLRFAGMDEWVSQMFNWASIVNSSINIFVYLWLIKDFRYEFARLFGILSFTSIIYLQFAAGSGIPS